MPYRAFKSGLYSAITATAVVCAASGAVAAPFQLDSLAPEKPRQAKEDQVTPNWIARRSIAAYTETGVDAGPGQGVGWLTRKAMSGGANSWRKAHLQPLAVEWDRSASSEDEAQLIRLYPVSSRHADHAEAIEGIFKATPGGRPISDAYDFAGADPDRRMPIMPLVLKRGPAQQTRAPAAPLVTINQNQNPAPPQPASPTKVRERERVAPTHQEQVLDLSVRTLDYVVLTTKVFVENLTKILKIFL